MSQRDARSAPGPSPAQPGRWLSERELCQTFSISRSTARRHLRAYAVLIGGVWRYSLSAILEAHGTEPDGNGNE